MKTIAIVAIIAAVVVVGGACAGVAFSGVLNGGTTGPGGNDPVVPTDPVDPTPTETPTETPTPTPTDSSMSYFSPMTSSGSSSGSSTPAHNTHTYYDVYTYDSEKHWYAATCCPDVKKDEAAHVYDASLNCAVDAACTICDYVKPAGEHTWGEWMVHTENEYSRTCTLCSAEERGTYLAAIDQEYYATLNYALDNATTGQTVTLLADMETSVTIPEGKEVIINPNGNKTLLNYESITDIKVQKNLGSDSALFVAGDMEVVYTEPADANLITVDYAKNDTAMHICTADGLMELAAMFENGDAKKFTSVLICANIDLDGEAWTPINAWDPENRIALTIDGQGHKISNMKVNGGEKLGFIGSNARDITIKDLTFDNAQVTTSASCAGVVIGYQYGDVVLENVDVTNSEVKTTASAGIRIGGLVGHSFLHDGATLTIKDCTVDNVEVTGYHNVAGLVGTLNNYDDLTDKWELTNNLVKNSKFTVTSANVKYGSAFAVEGANYPHTYEDSNEYFKTNGNNIEENNEVNFFIPISNAEELFAFAKSVNDDGNSYAGKVVGLTNNIDLENQPWTPIGQTSVTEFKGVFDGNGKTISNLNISNTDESAYCSTGLFGWIESHGDEGVTVKDLTIDGATVSGHHNVGVIVGYVYGTIENCHVTGAKISCTSVNDDANGDKCGGIAGYVGEDAKINRCTVSDSTITAGRDAGQVIGAAKPACVTECSATNVTVDANGTSSGDKIREEVIGREL